MNKALMKDLEKKRQAYLAKKAEAVTLMILGVVAGSVFAGLSVFAMLPSPSETLETFLICFIALGSGACAGCWLFHNNKTKVQSIAYVPPVAEQIAHLPLEEILVRGAEQPTAEPDELLRAAQKAGETASVQLLRPDENRTA